MSEEPPVPDIMTTMTLGDLASLAESILYEILARCPSPPVPDAGFDCTVRAILNIVELRQELDGGLDQHGPIYLYVDALSDYQTRRGVIAGQNITRGPDPDRSTAQKGVPPMPEELTFIGPLGIRTLGELTGIAKNVLSKILSRFDSESVKSDCYTYADAALGNVIALRRTLPANLDQFRPPLFT